MIECTIIHRFINAFSVYIGLTRVSQMLALAVARGDDWLLLWWYIGGYWYLQWTRRGHGHLLSDGGGHHNTSVLIKVTW